MVIKITLHSFVNVPPSHSIPSQSVDLSRIGHKIKLNSPLLYFIKKHTLMDK